MLTRKEKLTGLVVVLSHIAQIAGCYVLLRVIIADEGTSAYAGTVLAWLLALCGAYLFVGLCIFIADTFIMSVKERRGEMYRPLLLRNEWLFKMFLVWALMVYQANAANSKRQAQRSHPRRKSGTGR